MTKANWLLGTALGILGAVSFIALSRVARIEDRVAGLEDAVRRLSKGAAARPQERPPSTAPTDARVEALEKKVQEIQKTASADVRPQERKSSEASSSGEIPRSDSDLSEEDRVGEKPPAGPRPARRGAGAAPQEEREAGAIVARWQWRVFSEFLQLDAEQTGALEPVYRGLAAEMSAARERFRNRPDFGLAEIRKMDREMKEMLNVQARSRLKPAQLDPLQSWCKPVDPQDGH